MYLARDVRRCQRFPGPVQIFSHEAEKKKYCDQNDEKNTFLKYNIPLSILDEPVACARYFIRLIHLVLEELFGLTWSDYSMKLTVVKKTKGVFGRCVAAMGSVELQGRLALHVHLLIWGVDPTFVRYISNRVELREFFFIDYRSNFNCKCS